MPEDINLINRIAGPYERGKNIPYNPGNAPLRPLRLDRRSHLQSVNDVTERRGLDDEHFRHDRKNLTADYAVRS